MAPKILVIDDDDLARAVLCELLREKGCEVFDLPSAIGATRVITKEFISGVLVDVMLPDVDGDKLARMLRSHARGQELAILLVSSRPTDELEVLAVEAQADGVLHKEGLSHTLWPTLSSALLRRRRSRGG